jgi:hypothetical protein
MSIVLVGAIVFAAHLFGFDIRHLNWVEAVWIGIALIGLYYGWTNLQQAKADRIKAEDVHNGLRAPRIVVANGYVYRNRIRVSLFVWWLALGMLFGFWDPPSLPRTAGLLGLIVTAAGFAFIGAQEASERRTLQKLIRRREEEDQVDIAAETIQQRAAVVAARLEIVAQEAAIRLREIAHTNDHEMAADQKRSAVAGERTANAAERTASHHDGLTVEDAMSESDQTQP